MVETVCNFWCRCLVLDLVDLRDVQEGIYSRPRHSDRGPVYILPGLLNYPASISGP